MMTVSEFLDSVGIEPNTNSTNQVLTECRECDAKKLYIDAETGLYMCQRCGTTGNFERFRKYFEPPDPISETLARFHEVSVRNLIRDQHAREYLASRGFDEGAVDRFRYGYANASVYERLRRTLSDEDLAAAGLINKHGDIFTDHIIIPYIRAGQIVTLQGRNLSPTAHPKYIFATGRPNDLYHYEELYRDGPVVLTEGAFKRDRLILEGVNALSLSGANNWKRYVDELNMAKNLYICLDSDAENSQGKRPGNDAALAIAKALTRCTLMELPLDEGESKVGVDDFLDRHTVDDFWKIKQTTYREGKPQKPESLAVIVREWREKVESHSGPGGYTLGHPRLDSWTEGFHPGSLVFLGGGSHFGKTLFLEDAALRMHKYHPELTIDYYSNDDSLFTTITRWIAKLGRLQQKDCKRPLDSFADDYERMARYERAVDKLSSMSDRIKILDRSYNVSLERLRDSLLVWKEENPGKQKIVFIDAFTKTRTDRDREIRDEIGLSIYKSSLIKEIAQETNFPFVVTNEVPKLGGKRPNSWNLKGSASLEFDADVLFMCYQEAHVKGLDATPLVMESNGETLPIFELIAMKDKMCGTPRVTDLFAISRESSGFLELNDTDYHRMKRYIVESEQKEW